MKTNPSKKRAMVSALLVVLLVASACGGSDGSGVPDAATEAEEASASAPEVVDVTQVPPADGVAAESIVELAGAEGERPMAAGPWFSTTFEEPLAFDLPVAGRLLEQGRGFVTIEVGSSGGHDHGVVRIVEALAFASPEGPVPISTVGPDTEFDDARVLRRGMAGAAGTQLSWRDVVIDPTLVPAEFRQPCLVDASVGCVGGPIAESGEVFVELDRPVRFVQQPSGTPRLYVIATDLGSAETPADGEQASAPAIFDHALHVAASAVRIDRADDVDRRPLSTLGSRDAVLPSGTWFTRLGEVTVEITLDDDLADFAVVPAEPTFVAFQHEPPDGTEATFLAVQVFQGFVEGVLPAEAAGQSGPLPTATFLEGIETLVGLEAQGQSTVAGLDGAWFVVGEGAVDSPFACGPDERPPDLGPEDRCTRWTVDGWTFTAGSEGSDDGVDYLYHYSEELGVVITYPGVVDASGKLVADQRYAALVEGLTLTG